MAASSGTASIILPTRGARTVCVARAANRKQVAPKVQRRNITSGKPTQGSGPQTKGQAISLPWNGVWETEAPKSAARLEQEMQALREERDSLLDRCTTLEEEVELYKSQAAGFWWDYADARKRILGYMDTIDSLYSQLRTEKHARIEAEHRLQAFQKQQ